MYNLQLVILVLTAVWGCLYGVRNLLVTIVGVITRSSVNQSTWAARVDNVWALTVMYYATFGYTFVSTLVKSFYI